MSQDLVTQYNQYDSKKGALVPDVTPVGHSYVIRIKNDNDFNKLNDVILTAINNGEKNIYVVFKRGLYHFHQNHISIHNLSIPDVSIIIEGNGSTIIPVNKVYSPVKKNGEVPFCDYEGLFSKDCLFLDENGAVIDVWTPIRQSSGLVEVKNDREALLKTEYSGDVLPNARVRIPHWYYSGHYFIRDLSSDGVICFSPLANEFFKPDYDGFYVMNYDNRVSNALIRYQCFNVENKEVPYCDGKSLFFPDRYKILYECLAAHFIVISSSTLKQLTVTGLHCVGAQGDGHYINLSKVSAERILIKKCLFKGIKSSVLMINETDNVCFINNSIEHCFAYCVYSNSGSKNTIVGDCIFKNNGQNMTQHHCIYCGGENYHIYGNIIRDFSYSAIFVGVHYSVTKRGPSNGIIEGNDISFSKDYYNDYWKHTLADGGAVYITTCNDEVIIRNNYIHDYIGINGNRAIFGDDGAKNIIIYGNVIKNVPNYYAIDLYRVKRADQYIEDANCNNIIMGNYIDGAYLLGGRDNMSCFDGLNVLESNSYNRFNTPSVTGSNSTNNIELSLPLSRKQKRYIRHNVPSYSILKKYL